MNLWHYFLAVFHTHFNSFIPEFWKWTLPCLNLAITIVPIRVLSQKSKQNGKHCRSWWQLIMSCLIRIYAFAKTLFWSAGVKELLKKKFCILQYVLNMPPRFFCGFKSIFPNWTTWQMHNIISWNLTLVIHCTFILIIVSHLKYTPHITRESRKKWTLA